MKNDGKNSILAPLLFFLAVVATWEVVPRAFHVPSYVFARPSEVCAAIWDARVLAWNHVLVTSTEALAGLLLGGLVGFGVGMLMAEYPLSRSLILPYVIGSNAVPIVAIAPIVILWFGHGLLSKSVVAAFLCFFPLAINTFRGLTEYDPIYNSLFRVNGASRFQFFAKFKIVNAMPFVFSGLKLSATYAVIGAVVAEFVGADAGLGFGMLQASYSLNTPRLYGYVAISCLLGIAMYGAVVLVERLFVQQLSS